MGDQAAVAAALVSSITRSIIALVLTAFFCWGFLLKLVDDGVFAQTVSMVIAFWFGNRMMAPMTAATVSTPAATVEVKK